MTAPTFKDQPHRRFNPLTGEWILVSPHRTQRPWQGQVEKVAEESSPAHDPKCYLCPRNERAGGLKNPDYPTTFVFDNDYPALLPDTPAESFDEAGLLIARGESGTARVICFSPRHDLTMATMDVPALRSVVDMWADQYRELGGLSNIGYVQIFENRGSAMGASNPHPHGQIWASSSIPNEPLREQEHQVAYQKRHAECLLCETVRLEASLKERVVIENEHWVVLVPFWAIWPFETLVLPRRHVRSVDELEPAERDALADVLKRLTCRYDNVFEVSFPYSMGLHQKPTDGNGHPEWHLHLHFYPPLLRSATVRKFMVGFEMLGGAQRDITPESAAARLRELPEEHYRARRG